MPTRLPSHSAPASIVCSSIRAPAHTRWTQAAGPAAFKRIAQHGDGGWPFAVAFLRAHSTGPAPPRRASSARCVARHVRPVPCADRRVRAAAARAHGFRYRRARRGLWPTVSPELGRHRACVHWHIDPEWTVAADGARRVGHAASRRSRGARGNPGDVDGPVPGRREDGALGWVAPIYGRLTPATTLRGTSERNVPFWIVTTMDVGHSAPRRRRRRPSSMCYRANRAGRRAPC